VLSLALDVVVGIEDVVDEAEVVGRGDVVERKDVEGREEVVTMDEYSVGEDRSESSLIFPERSVFAVPFQITKQFSTFRFEGTQPHIQSVEPLRNGRKPFVALC